MIITHGDIDGMLRAAQLIRHEGAYTEVSCSADEARPLMRMLWP